MRINPISSFGVTSQIKSMLPKTSKNLLMASVICSTVLCTPLLSSCYMKSDKEMLYETYQNSPKDPIADDKTEENDSVEVTKKTFLQKIEDIRKFFNLDGGTVCIRNKGCRWYLANGISDFRALFCDVQDSGYKGTVGLTDVFDDSKVRLTRTLYKGGFHKTNELKLHNDTVYLTEDSSPVGKIYKTQNAEKYIYNANGEKDTIIVKNEEFPDAIKFSATVAQY